MPPIKLPPRIPIFPKCVYRAAYSTSRSRTPRPQLSSHARSRLSKDSQNATRRWPQSSQKHPLEEQKTQKEQKKKPSLSDALKNTKDQDNSLLSPVHIPEDPNGVLNEKHPAANILANSGIVVERKLELLNVMVGFEQANKYVILDPQGNHIGFMAEQGDSMGKMMARQMFSTHRSFTTHVFDKHEKEVLRFHRPFSWISSRIGVYDPTSTAAGSQSTSTEMISTVSDSPTGQTNGILTQISGLPLSEMRIIGEAQQQWAPLRRKYNLFLFHQPLNTERDPNTRQIASGDLPLPSSQQLQVSQAASSGSAGDYSQFAYVDEPFLSWDFSLRSAGSQLIGSVNRNWGGIGRELFTDTGVYALRLDAAGMTQDQRQLPGATPKTKDLAVYNDKAPGMTLDQRAVMLATAVSIDFDYFSRHSSTGGEIAWWSLWLPRGGGEAAAAGEAAEGAGAVGAAEEGSIIRGAGSAGVGATEEGAAVGAGSTAWYEALQRSRGGSGAEDASPTAGQPELPERDIPAPGSGQQQDSWWDPWNEGSGGGQSGGGGGGGGGGDGVDIGDVFEGFF
ncbi:MAG: hypothetical protein Q9201_002514 [Fulgogasparrea decipioides]